jgi:hypothetical protein
VPFQSVFLEGVRNTNWFCIVYTVRDFGHILVEFELATNMIFNHVPWELNDCLSEDLSKIMFTSTSPGCEGEIPDGDAGGHTARKDTYSEPERKCVHG